MKLLVDHQQTILLFLMIYITLYDTIYLVQLDMMQIHYQLLQYHRMSAIHLTDNLML